MSSAALRSCRLRKRSFSNCSFFRGIYSVIHANIVANNLILQFLSFPLPELVSKWIVNICCFIALVPFALTWLRRTYNINHAFGRRPISSLRSHFSKNGACSFECKVSFCALTIALMVFAQCFDIGLQDHVGIQVFFGSFIHFFWLERISRRLFSILLAPKQIF